MLNELALFSMLTGCVLLFLWSGMAVVWWVVA
jgi:hypothetical protein